MKNILIFSILILSSCVTKSKYKLAIDNAIADKKSYELKLANFNSLELSLNEKITSLEGEIATKNNKIVVLRDSIKDLKSKIAEEDAYILNLGKKLDEQGQKVAQLLAQKNETLQAKELDLNNALAKAEAERDQLTLLRSDLTNKSSRIQQLEKELQRKDSLARELKTMIQKALVGMEALDIKIEERNGKVYLSLSEQLLFPSGSIVVNDKGKQALLKITTALATQKDLNIMVEGHTDNKPMNSEKMKDNWDLSVLRATSIVRLLTTEGGLNPATVVASGRGQTSPITNNETVESRAKNRRTEIILTPNLDKLKQLLDN